VIRLVPLALVLLAGAASAQSLGDTSGTAGSTVSASGGEATYRQICQACHMAHAEGGAGAGTGVPALAANPHLADKAFVLDRLTHGKGGMPAFAGMLSPEQIAGVGTYVRTHFGNAYPDPVTPDEVKRLVGDQSGEN
jgi:mono/diheme cytochrome c family protein